MVASDFKRGIHFTRYEMDKAWIPRKCFVCGEKGGWGKNNVNTIGVHGREWCHFWAHFHPHCLKDAICCPGNYENWVVEQAVDVHTRWEKLLLSDRRDRKSKQHKLEKAQKSICKEE